MSNGVRYERKHNTNSQKWTNTLRFSWSDDFRTTRNTFPWSRPETAARPLVQQSFVGYLSPPFRTSPTTPAPAASFSGTDPRRSARKRQNRVYQTHTTPSRRARGTRFANHQPVIYDRKCPFSANGSVADHRQGRPTRPAIAEVALPLPTLPRKRAGLNAEHRRLPRRQRHSRLTANSQLRSSLANGTWAALYPVPTSFPPRNKVAPHAHLNDAAASISSDADVEKRAPTS